MARAKQKPIDMVISAIDRVTAPVRRINRSIESMTRPIRKVSRAFEKLGREAGLQRVSRAAQKVGQDLQRLGKRAALAGVAFGTSAVLGVTRFVGAADQIGKTADKVGVGVEALQELRFAADRAGVSQNTLDMALQRFARRSAEAAAGTGEARDAVRYLGIDLKDANGKMRPTEDLLGDVAEAMKGIEDPAVRLRVAFKLFDSEGAALVGMLKDGRDALRATRQEARDLDMVLSERTVRAAERTQDNFTRLRGVIEGLAGAIGEKVLPEVNAMVGRVLLWANANRDLIRDKVVEFATQLANGVRKLSDFLAVAVPKVWEMIDAAGGLKTVAAVAAGVIGGSLVLAVGALGAAIAATPIGWIIAGITAIAALAPVVIANWEPIKAFFADLWESVSEGPLRFLPGVGQVISAAKAIQDNWEPIKEFFEDTFAAARSAISATREFFGFDDEDEASRAAGGVRRLARKTPDLGQIVASRAEVSGQIGMRVSLASGLVGSIDGVRSSGGLGLAADVGPIMTR